MRQPGPVTVMDDRPGRIDKEALKEKYREERDKRLRPDGNAQYLRLTGHLAHYKIPRYVRVVEDFPMTISGKVRKVEMRATSIELLGLHATGAASGACRT